MNIFHTSSLPNGLRQETLSRLVRTLLLRLVDDNLGKQPEGEALLKVCPPQMACWMVCAPSAHAARIWKKWPVPCQRHLPVAGK